MLDGRGRPAARHIELADRLRALPQPVRAVTYPGAHHGFDAPARAVRFLSKIYNPTVAGEHGAYIGTRPQAREQAIHEVRRFVEQRF